MDMEWELGLRRAFDTMPKKRVWGYVIVVLYLQMDFENCLGSGRAPLTLNPMVWVNPPPSNGHHKGLL